PEYAKAGRLGCLKLATANFDGTTRGSWARREKPVATCSTTWTTSKRAVGSGRDGSLRRLRHQLRPEHAERTRASAAWGAAPVPVLQKGRRQPERCDGR